MNMTMIREALQKAETALHNSRPIKDHSVIPHNNHVEAIKAVVEAINAIDDEEERCLT